MRLGMVTYNLGRDWDCATIIKNCEETAFEGVELRTTHAHGVEVELDAAQRREVRARFADSAVEIAGLGSAFEYNSPDPVELRRHIDGTKEYVKLAADLGVPGVKVRPNRLHEDEGIPREKTFEQIGVSLRECGEFARDLGVQIRLEVHGRITCEPPNIRKILDYAACDNVFACCKMRPNLAIVCKVSYLRGVIVTGCNYLFVHLDEFINEFVAEKLFGVG